jgi:hypothetical protein
VLREFEDEDDTQDGGGFQKLLHEEHAEDVARD